MVGPSPALRIILLAALCCQATQAQMLDRNCFGDEGPQGILSDTFLASPVNNQSKALVYQGERDFSVNLIKALFEKYERESISENIFISPSSIYHTLMLAYFGSRGETQAELTSALGFSSLAKSSVLKTYMFDRAYQAVRENTPGLGYVFKHANKLYFEKDLKLNECLRLALGDQVELVNFKEDPEAARVNMNQWVEDNTNGIIKDLVPEGYVDYSTRASLVNAAYFKGQWSSQFKASDTKFGNFYIKRDQIRMVKFMQQKGSFNYYVSEELQAHVLELPYEGDHVSMLVILPPWKDDSLQETVRRMTPETMQGVIAEIKTGYGKVEKLDVMIPKFSISGSLELLEPLEKLNVSQLFGGKSNLTGFLDQYGDEKDTVSLNSAQHKSFIEVNEEGSEAAAATALLGFRSARPLFHSQFKADHPFLFLIFDKQTDTILFFGVYQHPPQP
jgi:serpin B